EAAGLSVLPALGRVFRAWCDVSEECGEKAVAAAAAQAAFDEYAACGQRIQISAIWLPVVESYLAAGDVDRAMRALDSAFQHVAETDEHGYEHELYRLKGECLLAGAATRGRRAAAIGSFERAIEIAAEQ